MDNPICKYIKYFKIYKIFYLLRQQLRLIQPDKEPRTTKGKVEFLKHKILLEPFADENFQFSIRRRPRFGLGLSTWTCMEVFNTDNDRGVISIPWLKPRALITPRSLLIHYITPIYMNFKSNNQKNYCYYRKVVFYIK